MKVVMNKLKLGRKEYYPYCNFNNELKYNIFDIIREADVEDRFELIYMGMEYPAQFDEAFKQSLKYEGVSYSILYNSAEDFMEKFNRLHQDSKLVLIDAYQTGLSEANQYFKVPYVYKFYRDLIRRMRQEAIYGNI